MCTQHIYVLCCWHYPSAVQVKAPVLAPALLLLMTLLLVFLSPSDMLYCTTSISTAPRAWKRQDQDSEPKHALVIMQQQYSR